MRICQECGKQNPDINQFCGFCGALLSAENGFDTDENEKTVYVDTGSSDDEIDSDFIEDIFSSVPKNRVEFADERTAYADEETMGGFDRGEPSGYHSPIPGVYDDAPVTRAYQRPVRTAWERRVPVNRYEEPQARQIDISSSPDALNYDDNFDNGRQEDYRQPPQRSAVRQKTLHPEARHPRRNIPYIIVAYFTALVSVLNFIIPFWDWLSVTVRVDWLSFVFEKHFNVMQLIDRAVNISEVGDLFGGAMAQLSQYGISTDMIGISPEQLSFILTTAKIITLSVFIVMGLALIFYVIFFVMAMFQSRAASGLGITASMLMLLGSGAFVFMVRFISDNTNGIVSLEPAAYQMTALSGVILLLCIFMSVLKLFFRK